MPAWPHHVGEVVGPCYCYCCFKTLLTLRATVCPLLATAAHLSREHTGEPIKQTTSQEYGG